MGKDFPLNDYQLDILKLFSRKMEQEDYIAIKRMIVRYLADKITDDVDAIWEKNNWTQEDMKRLLKTHNRTPYNPEN